MTSTSTYAGCVACLSVQAGVLVQESELVEARLERSQAQAKAQRAQQRLDEFLAQQPAPQVCLQPFLTQLPSVCHGAKASIPLSTKCLPVSTFCFDPYFLA